MILTIELYKDDYGYNAYISDNCGGSGIEADGSTPEELSENIKGYVYDYCARLDDDDDDE